MMLSSLEYAYESNIFQMEWVWCQRCTHTHCNLHLKMNVVVSINESEYIVKFQYCWLIFKISWVLMSSEKTILCWSYLNLLLKSWNEQPYDRHSIPSKTWERSSAACIIFTWGIQPFFFFCSLFIFCKNFFEHEKFLF